VYVSNVMLRKKTKKCFISQNKKYKVIKTYFLSV
jgi:hypothetical protein